MSFRFNKRVNLGNGLGLNVSKSGISTSQRTKFGTIGSKGFSIKTGIPGLTYRGSFSNSKSKNKNDGITTLIVWMIIGLVVVAILVIVNLFKFLIWGFARLNYLYFSKTKHLEDKE